LTRINVRNRCAVDARIVDNLAEASMTTGNLLYLVLCIGMFTVFAAVLAYESHHQSKRRPDVVPAPEAEPDRHPDALAA
jgi:hypothetical protein